MWIFTRTGMVSIVEHRDDPETLLVRARARRHLEAFRGHAVGTGFGAIWEDATADYRWRCEMSRAAVRTCVLAEIEALDYPNFKAAIPSQEHAYIEAAHETWAAMLGVQRRETRRKPVLRVRAARGERKGQE